MKKLLTLILTVILVLSIFSSCIIFVPNNTETETKTDTKTETNTNTEANTETGSQTGTNTGTSTQTNTNTGTSTQTNTNTGTREDINPEDIQRSTWQLNFIYSHELSAIGEPLASLLVDDCYLGGDFDIEFPDDITAGDTITVEYVGTISVQESYPGRMILDGEVLSYSFNYADVIHLSGEEFSIENIKNNYEYKKARVIIDREGRYVSLNEYTGNEIYLVTDQEALYGDLEGIQDLPSPLVMPVACMLAYNPRDVENGTDERTKKVTIDLGYHSSELVEILDNNGRRYAGYIGYNENGHQYIKYAPNTFSYYILVSCEYNANQACKLIDKEIENQHYEEYIKISNIELENNQVLVVFPSFDTYKVIQEELLDSLSALDYVKGIEVDYIEASERNEILEGYELYTDFRRIEENNKIIKTYEEFVSLFDLSDEKNAPIKSITEEIFEEHYFVFLSDFGYGHCVDELIVKDVRIIDRELYYSLYEYYHGIHCEVAVEDMALIVVPKAELGGDIPEEFDDEQMSFNMYLEKVEEPSDDIIKDEILEDVIP